MPIGGVSSDSKPETQQQMVRSEREKMAAGEWYRCIDDELEDLRGRARAAVHQHNSMAPDERGAIGPALTDLLGKVHAGVTIEAPFHCAYGFNIVLERDVFLNAGCVILDTATVSVGRGSLLGPGVHIYCPEHHGDPALRRDGLEIAKPVHIGADVWIGGRAVILGGVIVGDGAIVGAGSVVTRDVAPLATVVGNPARPVARR